MKFKFDSNQQFQLRAIESVIKLFEGQHYVSAQYDLNVDGLAAIPNCLEIDVETILQNLQLVQEANDLSTDAELRFIEAHIPLIGENTEVRFPNFSVEMETGTGKTYVYLRTILELYRCYGLRKFVIVVPSVAVREGVIKTLSVTESHLLNLYDNPTYHYHTYDSTKLSQIRQFALSDSVEIMVITIDSFNKPTNVIHQNTDWFQGEIPIHYIQATNPILILDEPQNMTSELSVRSLSMLNPLFALRYSATHRVPYNLVYRLTPAEAYRQGLVKRIEVSGVEQEDDVNLAFVKVNDISSKKNTITSRLSVHKLMRDGTVKEQIITVKPEDDLAEKTKRPEYENYIVDEISLNGEFVRFANGVEINKGESTGDDKDAIFETQIRKTIEEHFRKQERLEPLNIKVLSLFFIDRVDSYTHKDGVIRRLFTRCYNQVKKRNRLWRDKDVESVQAAYFAHKRTQEGEIIYQDSVTGNAKDDISAYDLIMKDKERLLSFEEPVSFIFSHSALREGWDNPNVFQICTLNQTKSEMKKRQEVGRGVRLAVDQSGSRIFDQRVNILTVIANESYVSYVESLQTEMEEEYGAAETPPPPVNKRKRGIAKLRKEYMLKPEFTELWEQIKQKTRYAVSVNTDQLISDVVEALDETEIRSPRITVTKAQVQVDDEDVFSAMQMSQAKTVIDLAGRYPLPNLIDTMMHLLENTTPPMRVTRKTLLQIFARTKKQQAALDNPHEFASVAVRFIKDKLTDQLIDGIKYEKIDEFYEMCLFEDEIESWKNHLVATERSLYDHIVFDSKNEREFVERLEMLDFVKLYVKLPAFFKVSTPIGTYNPDWAIMIDDPEQQEPKLYLVRETKSSIDPNDWRPDEKRKIHCGRRHFKEALGVNYEVIESADELRIESGRPSNSK